MKARELVNLKVGDVLPLDPDLFNQVRIRLAKMPKFQGRVGTQNNNWAVEITRILNT